MGDLFGDKLKEIRIGREMSQEQFANLLGTSKQVISRYETNQRTPKITVAQEYADKLNVPLNYLIDESVSSVTDTNALPALTPKDERDIVKDLENILNAMDNEHGMAAYDDSDDEEDRELLKASLLYSMKLAKQMAKKKFTPNKYKK